MSKGVNKVILVGNVGEDPRVNYTKNGKAVASLSLATSLSWKNKETGTEEEHTEWHKIVFFGRLAEIISEFVKKGIKIYVEGSIKTREYTDSSGITHKITEIIGNDLQIFSGFPNKNSPQIKSSEKPEDTFYDDNIPF